MNVEKLKTLVQKLIEKENAAEVQARLNELNEAFVNLAANPAEPARQVEVSNKLKELSEKLTILTNNFDAASVKKFSEIGAADFFSINMVEKIKGLIQANPMTPAVVQQEVKILAKRRQVYLNHLNEIVKNFSALNIESDLLAPGSAEVGFQIPRQIFDNNLEGLISELRELRLIIRAFSELATGSAEPIEIRQISTSDPQFFFGLSVATILMIGNAVNWALDKWQQIEEIRKIRKETLASPVFKPEEVQGFFGEKIKDFIKEAVEERTKILVAGVASKDGPRNKELSNHVQKALESILARVERGMTVEIRFLPPSQSEDQVDAGTALQDMQNFTSLKDIANKLVFPKPDPNPILTLTRRPEDK